MADDRDPPWRPTQEGTVEDGAAQAMARLLSTVPPDGDVCGFVLLAVSRVPSGETHASGIVTLGAEPGRLPPFQSDALIRLAIAYWRDQLPGS